MMVTHLFGCKHSRSVQSPYRRPKSRADVVQPGQMSHGTIQVAVTAHYKGALLHKHTSTKHACANTNGQGERASARTPK